jgi:hypothetical protein
MVVYSHDRKQTILLAVLLTLILSAQAFAQPKTYFVATDGISSNTGLSIDQPLDKISTALSKMAAGDTIYVRGGTYITTAQISLSTNGTDSLHRSNLIAYPGERPILDFSSMGTPNVSGSTDGIRVTARYWYIKGLDIKGAQHNGLALNGGSYDIVENCAFYENRNSGLQIGNNGSYNKIINCDAYYNRDSTSSSYDGNADGFSPKLDVGTGNYFYGCRSWQNSDDGWDGYMRPSDNVFTTLENCWCFMNGYKKDGTVGTGNGNGFKMGGGDTSNKDSLRHNMTLINCLSFDNKVKGFDQNNDRGSMTMYNCTGYRNGTYNFSVPGKIRMTSTVTIENCISLASNGVNLTIGGVATPILATNSWPDASTYPTAVTSATDADFVSLDTSGVRGSRKPDGSLPDITFMHLAPGSQFINAGTNLGFSYNGSAPDLGCFESDYPTSVASTGDMKISGFQLFQNYPNPFNPSTVITFSVAKQGAAKLKVVNILGQEIAVLFNGNAEPGIINSVQFNASSLPSGVYFSMLESNGNREVRKMLLMK